MAPGEGTPPLGEPPGDSGRKETPAPPPTTPPPVEPPAAPPAAPRRTTMRRAQPRSPSGSPAAGKAPAQPATRAGRTVDGKKPNAQLRRGAAKPTAPAAGAATKPVDIEAEQSDPLASEELSELAVRNAPAWLVSLVFHTLLIILLALLYVTSEAKPKIDVDATFAEELGKQLDDDTFDSAGLDTLELDDPVFARDEMPSDVPLASALDLKVRPDGYLPTDTLDTPSIGLALTGREAGMKQALLAKYGGTALTEQAVVRALDWIARQQRRDGTWSLKGPYSDGASVENTTAATAMALLAFQGAGMTHRAGRHKEHVRRGWQALLKMQDKEGNFFRGEEPDHRLYSQAQATIALCEIYGMTQDPMFAQPAQLAIDYAVKIQDKEGGWRYQPGNDSDTSVTGWFVMALQSAMMAGLQVPQTTLQQISQYLDTVAVYDGSFYKYQPTRKDFTVSMTAEGLLCRQYLGWKKSNPHLIEGAQYLLENPVDWHNRDVYYWYYATQVLHHLEDPYWDRWNNVMRKVLPANQVSSGPEQGSWDAMGDRWGINVGRLYVTCMSVFMLEVYYRHLPIYAYRPG